MNDKDFYRQKKQAQLDEWKAELARLKAKASALSADAQLQLNKRIRNLEENIEHGASRLKELAEASDDAWESIKEGFESAWESLTMAFSDAMKEFRK